MTIRTCCILCLAFGGGCATVNSTTSVGPRENSVSAGRFLDTNFVTGTYVGRLDGETTCSGPFRTRQEPAGAIDTALRLNRDGRVFQDGVEMKSGAVRIDASVKYVYGAISIARDMITM